MRSRSFVVLLGLILCLTTTAALAEEVVVGGVIESDTTWTAENHYVVTSDLLVPTGVTLTVEPGVTVSIDRDLYVRVDGTLHAVGTTDVPISFGPSDGNWGMIWFSASAVPWDESTGEGCVLENCTLNGGGINIQRAPQLPSGVNSTIVCAEVSVRITDCVIRSSRCDGLRFVGTEFIVEGTLVQNNDRIGVLPLRSEGVIRGNTIVANGEAGIYLMEGTSGALLVSGNVLANNGQGFRTDGASDVVVEHNLIFGNVLAGVAAFGPGATYANNSFLGDVQYAVRNAHSQDLDARNCWWGTTDPAEIEDAIYDQDDYFDVGSVLYVPFRSAPDPDAPPLLYRVAITPSSPVGAGTVTFELTFSKPMDTEAQPSVTFGLAAPYEDHEVVGHWSDADTWLGSYEVDGSTGDGTHVLKVTGARDPDGMEIPPDTSFQFEVQAGETGFSDVTSEHWAREEIAACASAGIVSGYEDGSYRPEGAVTRDQMAAYISRALAAGDENVPEPSGEPTFDDVSAEHWAYAYVEYAAAANIVTGYGDGLYHPEGEVDRGQMAVYIARSMVDPTGEDGLTSYEPPAIATFEDVPEDSWARVHVEFCEDRGVVQGYGDGLYHPELVVTRDQMAAYIARAFDLLP